jgi:hypothetical protein
MRIVYLVKSVQLLINASNALVIIIAKTNRYAPTTNVWTVLLTRIAQTDRYAPTTNALTVLMTTTAQTEFVSIMNVLIVLMIPTA